MTEHPGVMCSQVYMDRINALLWEGPGEGVGRPKLEVRIGAFGSHLPGLIEKQVPGHPAPMQVPLALLCTCLDSRSLVATCSLYTTASQPSSCNICRYHILVIWAIMQTHFQYTVHTIRLKCSFNKVVLQLRIQRCSDTQSLLTQVNQECMTKFGQMGKWQV